MKYADVAEVVIYAILKIGVCRLRQRAFCINIHLRRVKSTAGISNPYKRRVIIEKPQRFGILP